MTPSSRNLNTPANLSSGPCSSIPHWPAQDPTGANFPDCPDVTLPAAPPPGSAPPPPAGHAEVKRPPRPRHRSVTDARHVSHASITASRSRSPAVCRTVLERLRFGKQPHVCTCTAGLYEKQRGAHMQRGYYTAAVFISSRLNRLTLFEDKWIQLRARCIMQRCLLALSWVHNVHLFLTKHGHLVEKSRVYQHALPKEIGSANTL